MLLSTQKPFSQKLFRGRRSPLLCLVLGLVLGGCALSEPTSEQLMMRTAPVNPEERRAQRRLLHPSADHGWGMSLGTYWQRLRLQLGEYVGDADAASFRQRTAGGRLFVRTPALSRGENSQLHVTLISRVGVETEFNTMVVGIGARLTVHVP